jgi:hypothetical protein
LPPRLADYEQGGRESGRSAPEVSIVNRYYFHLVDDYDVIADETGIDVADLKEAYIEATKAILEFREEHSARPHSGRDGGLR